MAMTLPMRMKMPAQRCGGSCLAGRNAQLLAFVGDSDVRNFLQMCDSGDAHWLRQNQRIVIPVSPLP
jgi:hypothetical protein